MKKGLLFSTMLLLVAVFLVANALADAPKRPVSPSFENSVKSSPASARSLLSAPREMLGATLNVPSGLYPTIQAAVDAANLGADFSAKTFGWTGRANLTVFEAEDAVTVECHVEQTYDDERAQADIAEMARRYDADEMAEREIARFRTEPRVTFILRPDRVLVHGSPS